MSSELTWAMNSMAASGIARAGQLPCIQVLPSCLHSRYTPATADASQSCRKAHTISAPGTRLNFFGLANQVMDPAWCMQVLRKPFVSPRYCSNTFKRTVVGRRVSCT